MADNTTLNTGSGGDVIATDDIGGVKHQRVKVEYGADGSATDVSESFPLPTKESDGEIGLVGGLTNYRERVVAPRYTVLADSIADGLASFWTTTAASGGTATVTGGEGVIATSANAAGSIQITSSTPPYLPGQSAWLACSARFGDSGSAGNIRRIGAFTVSGTTPQDGFAFELNGTTFNFVTFKGGVATTVAAASWTKFSTAPFTIDANYHLWEFRWAANRVDVYIDNVHRHSVSPTGSAITNTLNFPITIQSINSSGATDRVVYIRNIGMGRFGTTDNPITTYSYSVAGVIAINTVLMTIDCQSHRSLSIQLTSLGTTGVITPEWSNDGTNWSTATTTSFTGGVGTTYTGAAFNAVNVIGRYFRLRMSTATTAGTTTVTVACFPDSIVQSPAPVGNVIAGTGSTALGKAEDAAAGSGDTGVMALAVARASPVNSAAAGDYHELQVNSLGSLWVQPTMGTTGGATVAQVISAATTNATNIKASAGTLTSLAAVNNDATTWHYLKFHNTAGTPTAGSGVVATFGIPPGGGITQTFPTGMAFSTGIGITITAGIAAADTTAIGASEVAVTLTYH